MTQLCDKQGNALATGEVCINSQSVMKGYYRNPEATEEAVEMASIIVAEHGKLSEWVYAYIVLEAEIQVDEENLILWSKEQLAGYEYPCRIFIRESLPMTATGKTLKRELTVEMT